MHSPLAPAGQLPQRGTIHQHERTLSVFGAAFIAEPGNNTRLATLLFAADRGVSRWTVFPGALLAHSVAPAVPVCSRL